jgi:hypothetical protein
MMAEDAGSLSSGYNAVMSGEANDQVAINQAENPSIRQTWVLGKPGWELVPPFTVPRRRITLECLDIPRPISHRL